jgi:putative transposase
LQIEDAQTQREILLKMEAIEDIRNAAEGSKQERVKQWAQKLGKHPRTITRMLSKAQKEGLAAIAKAGRSDAGKHRGKRQWQPSVKYWIDFIEKTYTDGNKHSRRMNRSQEPIPLIGFKESKYV